MADFSGLTNPKRVIEKRLEAAESPAVEAAEQPASAPRFGKQFSPADRQRQQMKLAEALRRRQ